MIPYVISIAGKLTVRHYNTINGDDANKYPTATLIGEQEDISNRLAVSKGCIPRQAVARLLSCPTPSGFPPRAISGIMRDAAKEDHLGRDAGGRRYGPDK
jgi:hypothetical protein